MRSRAGTWVAVGIVLAMLTLTVPAAAAVPAVATVATVRLPGPSPAALDRGAVEPAAVGQPAFGPVTTIPVGPFPDALALNVSAGTLYVANDDNNSVAIVDVSTDSVTGWIPGLSDPEGLALDPTSQLLFVPDFTPCCPTATVTVVNTSTDLIQTTTPIGVVNPSAAVYDPLSGQVFVSDTNGGGVTVLSGATGALVTTIVTGGAGNPLGLAFDPANGDVYVATDGGGNVTVINGSSDARLTSFPVAGLDPTDVAVDAASGRLYVSDTTGCFNCSGDVSVLNATDGSVLATVPVGLDPRAIVVDPALGRAFVTTGSPLAGGNGSVGVGSLEVVSMASDSVVGAIPVGHNPDAVTLDTSNADLYVANGGSNTVSVIPANLSSYLVTVNETGLPSGTPWYVQLADGETYYASASSLAFYETNGSFPITAATPTRAYVAENFGPLVVNGTATTLNVTFLPNPDVLTFAEQGLPHGEYWAVSLTGSIAGKNTTVSGNSTSSTITFLLTNGTFNFSVEGPLRFAVSPASGSVTLAGAPATVSVTFGRQYPVTFVEVGLPSGTNWSVSLSGQTNASTSGQVGFWEANGSYAFAGTSTLAAYVAVPAAGSLSVDGLAASATLTFYAISAPVANPASSVDVGQALTFSTTAQGGRAPLTYTWAESSSDLGCTLANATEVRCLPTVAGSYTVAVNVTDNGGVVSPTATSAAYTVYPLPATSTPAPARPATDVGQALGFTATLEQAGAGGDSYAWSVVPATGLGCAASTSLSLSCTSTAAGSYVVSLSVTDANGGSSSTSVSVTVYADVSISSFVASPSSLLQGKGTTLSVVVTGGRQPLRYAYSGLPSGCTTTNASTLSCSPTASGSFSLRVTVTDADGGTATTTTTLTVHPSLFGLPLDDAYGLIAGVVLAVIVGLLVALLVRRRRLRSSSAPAPNGPTSPGGGNPGAPGSGGPSAP